MELHTEPTVREIATKVGNGQTTSVEDMPSWGAVKQLGAMKVEAFSLMRVVVVADSIKMTKREVQRLMEEAGHEGQEITRKELRYLPGKEGKMLFEDCFTKEDFW